MTLSDPSATFQGFNDSHSRAVSPRQLSFLSSKDGPLHDTLTRFRSPSQSTKRSRTGDQRKLPSGLTQLLQSTGGGTEYGPLAAAASAINQTFERLVQRKPRGWSSRASNERRPPRVWRLADGVLTTPVGEVDAVVPPTLPDYASPFDTWAASHGLAQQQPLWLITRASWNA